MSAARVKAGDVLGGKYRVERVLGTGGMGMVVAARHVQLGQRVALKFMLKEAMADPGNAERFAREARSAVRLQSPHTARVSDVGKLKNGEPYMVMEYLDGHDLDEVLRQHGPMPPLMAVDYILQACEAFAEAHGLGMIHRDIKPKNLFLSQTVSGTPIVKVLDFGLAKTIGGMGEVALTATSAVFGSPQYMSPEQMRSAKDVDARSDIWSIGVCLYELLTTRVPFDAGGLAEICAMVLKDPVEPPSKWVASIPLDLDAVVVKCLEKDPANRYQTVAELAFALEPWCAIEGSAKRILNVMQTVQKTDFPTMMNIDGTVAADDGPKTMDAWDSGERTRPTTRRLTQAQWVMAFCGLLGVTGLVFGGVAIVRKLTHPSAVASAGPSATPSPSSLIPEPVETVAVTAEPPPPAPAPPDPLPVAPALPTPTAVVTAAVTAGATEPTEPPPPPVVAVRPTATPKPTVKPPPPRPPTVAVTSKPTAPPPTVQPPPPKPVPAMKDRF